MARNWLDLDSADDWFRQRRDPWRSLDRLEDDLFADFTAKAASLRRRLGGRRDSTRYPDHVSLPSSSSYVSTASNASDNSSEDASVCTERSSTRSEVSEQLPNGRQQHKMEEAEKWVSRDDDGRVRGEGTSSDTLTTEKGPGSVQEVRKQESSYVETSGDSLASKSTITENYSSIKSSLESVSSSTKSNSSDIASSKTTRQTGKPFRVPPNRSAFYDELDSSLLSPPRPRPRSRALDAVARLVDEVINHDRLFQTDIDDFISRRHSLFSATENEGSPRRKSSEEDLQKKLSTLQQENARLQAALQEVTTVNKRWQRYNNERRVYVQKLLATIQEQQDQLDKGKTGGSTEETFRERCAALEIQAKSNKEDWEKERREKRKAEEEKVVAEEKLKEAEREVQQLNVALEEERGRRFECNCTRPASQVTSRDFAFCTQVQVPYNPAEEQSPSPSQSRCSARSSPRSVYLGFPDPGYATVRAFSAEPFAHRQSQVPNYNIPVRTPSDNQSLVDNDSVQDSMQQQKHQQDGLDPASAEMKPSNIPYRIPGSPDHLRGHYQPPPHFMPPPPYYPNMGPPRFHHPYYDYPRSRPDQPLEPPVVCPNCGRAFSPALRVCFEEHIDFCKNTDATNNTYPTVPSQ